MRRLTSQSGSWAIGTATWPSDDSDEESRHHRLSSPRRRGPIPTELSVIRRSCDIESTRRMGPRFRGDDRMADLTDRASAAPSVTSRTRASTFGWRGIVLALLIIFLTYQVIIPFLMIIWTSLKTARPGE